MGGAPATSTPTLGAWDRGYEIRAVALLSIGFGLVGLDRFIIFPLFPVMSEDLGLDYSDLGLISAVLALTWGVSSIFSGKLSDLIGARRVLVTSVILFSVLVASSGLATGLVSLLIIRALMGLAEGGYVPPSIVATVQASKPSRKGLNVGVQQMAMPLFGLGLAPIIAIGLLGVLPSWEWVFGVVALPGFLVAYLLARTIRNPQADPPAPSGSPAPARPSIRACLGYRNVVFATVAMCFLISCLMILSTFLPSYLTDHVGLTLQQMGLVIAMLGVGGVGGMIAVPAASDVFGRKPAMVVALLVELAALLVLVIVSPGAVTLAMGLFVISFANAGVVATIVGPFMSETVPRAIAATATGLVTGIGEIVGGAMTPALTGMLAQATGIDIVLDLAMGAATIGFLVIVLGFREPQAATHRRAAAAGA